MTGAHSGDVARREASSPNPSRKERSQTSPLQRYLGERIFARPGLPIAVNTHRLRGDHESHDHDFLELAFIAGGCGVHRTIHGDRELRAGDVVFLRPGEWHAYLRCQGLDVTNCCFGVAPMQRELAWLVEHPAVGLLLAGRFARPVVVTMASALRRRCGEVLEAMRRELAAASSLSDARSLAWLTLLLTHVASVLPSGVARDRLRPHPAVEAVAELCRMRLQDDLTLAALAEQAALDPAYLVRLFRKHTGLPPMAYLTQMRLERAAVLLLRTDRSVSEIAQSVGLYDPNYFTRRFRLRFGVTPTAYRERRSAQ